MIAFRLSLIGALCGAAVDAYSASDACRGEAVIVDSQNPSNFQMTLSLGNSDSTTSLEGTNGQAPTETKLGFSLEAGTYDITINTYGCANAVSPKPGPSVMVHSGKCTDVVVSAESNLVCDMFMINQQTLDTQYTGNNDEYTGKNAAPAITSLVIDDQRLDVNKDDPNPTTMIHTTILDLDRRQNAGHEVTFHATQDNDVSWSVDAATLLANSNSPDANQIVAANTPNELSGRCKVTNMQDWWNTGDESGSFSCDAELQLENNQANYVLFEVTVADIEDNIKQNEYVVYGSIAVDRAFDNDLTIAMTHRPKICDGYHFYELCDQLHSASTDAAEQKYTRGPSMVVNTAQRYQTGLGIASNPFGSDLVLPFATAGGSSFDNYDRIRVPVSFTGGLTGSRGDDDNFKKQYIVMEAFVTDEDFTYSSMDITEKVRLSITLQSKGLSGWGETNNIQRVDPGCGKFYPLEEANQIADSEPASAVVGTAYQAATAGAQVLTNDVHGKEAGTKVADNKFRSRRFQWLWFPFASIDLSSISSETSPNVASLEDYIGQQRCEFTFSAFDNSAAFSPGNDIEDQQSNTVVRSFVVGSDPAKYEIAKKHREPTPRFTGAIVWNKKPTIGSKVAMEFQFVRTSLCADHGHASTVGESDDADTAALKAYCNDVEGDWEVVVELTAKTNGVDDSGGLKADTVFVGQWLTNAQSAGTEAFKSSRAYVKDAVPVTATLEMELQIHSDAEVGDVFNLNLIARNVNSKSPDIEGEWFTKNVEFEVVESSGPFYPAQVTTTAPSRARRALTTELVSWGGRSRRNKNSLDSGSLIAPGHPIKIVVGGKSDEGVGVEVSFHQKDLFDGVEEKISGMAIDTNTMLARTADLCDILLRNESHARSDMSLQIQDLVVSYGKLLTEMQSADATTTGQISKIMEKLVAVEQVDKKESSAIVKLLRDEVSKLRAETSTVEEVVLKELKTMAEAANKTDVASIGMQLKESQVYAYLINKMESFEEALALIQYSAAEAVEYRFVEKEVIDELKTDPAAVHDDKWMTSAAGATQITTLVLISTMFLYMLVRCLGPVRGPGDGQFFPLKNSMNF